MMMNVHALIPGEQVALDIDSGESFGWQGTPRPSRAIWPYIPYIPYIPHVCANA